MILALMPLSAIGAEAKKATVYHPVFGDMKVVEVGDPNAFNGGYKLLTNNNGLIGAKVFRPSAYSTTLASNLAEGGAETTLKVNSITLKDGTSMSSDNYGSFLILTVGTGDNEEKIAVSDLATSTKTFTIISRGLEYGRWASSTDNIKQHLPGERVYVSDDDHFLNQKYADLATTETITGQKTFTQSPILPTPSSSDLTYGANVEYVNSVATSGVADMSETIAGKAEIGTRSEISSGTSIGNTGARLVLPSSMATSSSDVATSSIVITGTDGKINQNFIDLTDSYSWSGSHTFSNATTTISGRILSDTNIVTLTASTTITGATIPQAVYLATSTGALLLTDTASSTNYSKEFFGFAISSGTNGSSIYVQYDGIVSGFAGLTPGAIYYATTTGAITTTKPTTAGSIVLEVGQAVSATQLRIDRRKNYSTAITMTSATTYSSYTDSYVYCYGSGSEQPIPSLSGTINGVVVIVVADSWSSAGADTNNAGFSMFVPKGNTFSCTSSGGATFTLKYIPYN